MLIIQGKENEEKNDLRISFFPFFFFKKKPLSDYVPLCAWTLSKINKTF